MEKRKEAGCALAASLLAGALALPTAALEVSQAWGVEPEAAKDEVVYVKAGADGATQGLYVVNVFDTGSVQTVDDPALHAGEEPDHHRCAGAGERRRAGEHVG